MATTNNTQKISEMILNLESVTREAKHLGCVKWETYMEIIRMIDPVFTTLAEKLDNEDYEFDADRKMSNCFLDLLDFFYDRRAENQPGTLEYNVVNSLYDIVHETYFGE